MSTTGKNRAWRQECQSKPSLAWIGVGTVRKSRLIYFGTEDFSAASLTMLLTAGYEVAAVVTKPDAKAGRGRQNAVPIVKKIAAERDIPVLQPEKVSQITDELKKFKADFGVLAAYGKIVPKATLDLFPGGIINVHPSLLPKYRGPSPIEMAILNGDKQTGISLMHLNEGVDEGPVYAQKRVKLDGTEIRTLLYQSLAVEGGRFLIEKLPDILDGSLKPKPQDDPSASYTSLLKKEDGIMDFSKPAQVLEREVRAYFGWPKSVTRVFGQKIIVTEAKVAKKESKDGLFMKAHPNFLEILELIGPSGRTMSGKDFLHGYKK